MIQSSLNRPMRTIGQLLFVFEAISDDLRVILEYAGFSHVSKDDSTIEGIRLDDIPSCKGLIL